MYAGLLIRDVPYMVGANGSILTRLEWADDQSSSAWKRIGINDVVLPEQSIKLLSWSPDGQSLAFAAAFYGEVDHLYVAKPGNGDPRQILDVSNILEDRQCQSRESDGARGR